MRYIMERVGCNTRIDGTLVNLGQSKAFGIWGLSSKQLASASSSEFVSLQCTVAPAQCLKFHIGAVSDLPIDPPRLSSLIPSVRIDA